MKLLKDLALSLSVSFLLAVPAVAAEKTCCEKAKAEGKACTHKCCVTAKQAGKTCEKCNPKKKDPSKKT